MFRGLFEGWHLPLLIIVLILLFGAKRLPDAARGLGRSLRIFKAETEGLRGDSQPEQPAAPTPPASLEQNPPAAGGNPVQAPPQSTQAPDA